MLKRFSHAVLAGSLAAAMGLTGCGTHSDSALPLTPTSTNACPAATTRLALTCFSGGGYQPHHQQDTLDDGSVSVADWDGAPSSWVYGSGTSPTGSSEGTTSGYWRYDATGAGGVSYDIQAPSVSPSQIRVEQTDWTYLVDGTNSLANGVTLNINGAANTAAADFAKNGINYHIDFALEADGDTVDATFTQSNRVVSTAKYKASQIMPSTSTITSALSSSRMAMGARHTLGNLRAAKLAGVASLVCAVAGAVTYFFPPAAPIAAPIVAVSGVVAAVATVIDIFTPDHKKT